MAKQKLNVNHETQTITMTQAGFEELTDAEFGVIERYKKIGYEVIISAPTKKSRKGTGDKTTEAEIRKIIGDDKEAIKEFERIKVAKGYVGARSWFKKEYTK